MSTRAEEHQLSDRSQPSIPHGTTTQITINVFDDGSVHAQAYRAVDGAIQSVSPTNDDIGDAEVEVLVAIEAAFNLFGGDLEDVSCHDGPGMPMLVPGSAVA